MRGRVVVIGGGPNGLAATALLARAGYQVTLLERREILGGVAAGEEFHPGYRTTGLLHTSATFRPGVAKLLDLANHGLAFVDEEPPVRTLERDGPGLVLARDPDRARAALAARSERDAEAYGKWRGFVRRVRSFVTHVLSDSPPELDATGPSQLLLLLRKGVALRSLGESDMLELMRIGPMCAGDWLKDLFETPLLRATLAAPAVEGTWLGPWSSGSGATLLAHECTYGRTARGGPAAIVRALAASATDAGAELRTGAEVEAVEIEGGSARGVRLAGGEVVLAPAVISTIEPKRALLGLVPRGGLPTDLESGLHGWRTRGTTAKLHLALDGPLPVPGAGAEPDVHLRTGETLDELERAFDAVKYGRMSERPLLDVRVPSVLDPSLAPDGRHTVSILAHFVPYELAGGWTDAARTELERRVLETLEEVLPGARARTLAVETLAPPDLEERYGLTGGHVHHGEHSLDQLLFMRPNIDCGYYVTPIPGLFLGGSGSHPGGGVTGMPGVLGARAVLGS